MAITKTGSLFDKQDPTVTLTESALKDRLGRAAKSNSKLKLLAAGAGIAGLAGGAAVGAGLAKKKEEKAK